MGGRRLYMRRIWLGVMLLIAISAACACAGTVTPPRSVIVHDYVGDLPPAVLKAFSDETGITVEFVAYEGPEEAVANLRTGKVYDLVVMENRYIPALIQEDLLAPIDHHRIPNFKNISLNFRDLIYDPGNRYSVPYSWGTTGMLVRTDLVDEAVTHWSDLWDDRYQGKVALWRGQGREVISLTLRSLGYSANDESPQALAAVQARLEQLRPFVRFFEDTDPVSAAPLMAEGEIALSMGYSGDVMPCRTLNLPVDYRLPAEGALLWGDNFVVPANAPHPEGAAALIDFLLRPDIGAQITQSTFYATANEAAMALLDPTLATDPALFPPQSIMSQLEIVLPLSPQGEELYAHVWEAFLAAGDGA